MRWKFFRSRMASSPEDHSAVATFLATLRSHHPLLPRRLVDVRRSRWASPWEMALLLTRFNIVRG